MTTSGTENQEGQPSTAEAISNPGGYLWTEPHELITGPCTVKDIRAFVIAVIPEFHQAELQTRDGYRYALTDRTVGISLANVRPGQEYECTVTVEAPRVLKARLL